MEEGMTKLLHAPERGICCSEKNWDKTFWTVTRIWECLCRVRVLSSAICDLVKHVQHVEDVIWCRFETHCSLILQQ